MIVYSEENLNEIFSSEIFLKEYDEYKNKKECNDFIKFINSIELNTKYFRLTTNNRIGRNKRFKNKNCSNDTVCLKEVNSLLNKLTDKNTDSIIESIKIKLKNKNYLKDLIIKNIMDKCIVHSNYIHYYILVLKSIYEINSIIINKNIDEIYKNINSKDIDLNQVNICNFVIKIKN